VDLTKPLLGLFELNQCFYKTEYEELHFLCLACGRFGHYVEGCPDKDKANTWQGTHGVEQRGDNVEGASHRMVEGP